MIETYKPDKIKAISADEKVYGETNYTSKNFLTMKVKCHQYA